MPAIGFVQFIRVIRDQVLFGLDAIVTSTHRKADPSSLRSSG